MQGKREDYLNRLRGEGRRDLSIKRLRLTVVAVLIVSRSVFPLVELGSLPGCSQH